MRVWHGAGVPGDIGPINNEQLLPIRQVERRARSDGLRTIRPGRGEEGGRCTRRCKGVARSYLEGSMRSRETAMDEIDENSVVRRLGRCVQAECRMGGRGSARGGGG